MLCELFAMSSRYPTSVGFSLETLARRGGLRALYTGWAPAVQRAMLVQLGDLTAYDQAKQTLHRDVGIADGPLLHACSSAVAGLVAATFGAPADVVNLLENV